ncbi:alpha/beta-hydrolase [Periconia macrospinosa]|uniref:Alpha/beta-hydrolase n=1 Tax=Periconia macrospinosa TaxID=97972 RepID=A0A2V1DWZ8_9PLEO|nr:alpha/beta-hydrolase [Periconia macrospinosa]
MSCPQCFTGHINTDSPTGHWGTIYGLRTYIAAPTAGKEPLGIVVIIPDAFGVDFINNQILADHYASAAQFLVYLPDFMDGQAAPVRTMINMAHMFDEKERWIYKPYYLVVTMIDFLPFLYRNRLSVCWPRVTTFLEALREDKATLPVGIAGFCWGGLHAVKLSHDFAETKTGSGRPLVDAIFTAHPSNLNVSEDIGNVKLNLSIAIGDDDGVMRIQQIQEAQKILSSKPDVDSEVVIYPGAKHGFSIRASRVKPDSKETRQAEEAEMQAIRWFQRHFRVPTANKP